jgi:beta-glucosidase
MTDLEVALPAMPEVSERVHDLLAQMTLEEKASVCSGGDAWHTQGVERVGLPRITMTDGPHGVRLQLQGGLANAQPATCFPTASALAATWDPELIAQVGRAIADECLELGVSVLLGPGAVKRDGGN